MIDFIRTAKKEIKLFKDLIVLPAFLNIASLLVMALLLHVVNFDVESKNETVIKNFLDVSSDWQTTIFIFAIIILTPIFEEFMFRNVLWNLSRKVFSEAITIHFVAIVFCVAHFDLFTSIGLIPFAYYLSHLRATYGTIKATIFAHIVFNAVGMLTLLN
jgi:membrane protease YdiL (CAAX protease family)